MCIHIYIYIYVYIHVIYITILLSRLGAGWLRTNGVNAHGAAANIINMTDWEKRYALQLLGISSRLTEVPKKHLCQKT